MNHSSGTNFANRRKSVAALDRDSPTFLDASAGPPDNGAVPNGAVPCTFPVFFWFTGGWVK